MDNTDSAIYIRSFSEIKVDDVGIVGGKGANLGEMTGAGLPVPPGFVVTAQAYRLFIDRAGVQDQMHSVIAEIHLEDPGDVETKTAQIRRLLLDSPMPAEIKTLVIEHYRSLSAEMDFNRSALVAVSAPDLRESAALATSGTIASARQARPVPPEPKETI